MTKPKFLTFIALFGCLAVSIPADVSAASPNEFRDALFADCKTQIGDSKGYCIRGRAIVFDQRKDTARANYKVCLNGGGSRGECDAKQIKYWKDLKVMFGL